MARVIIEILPNSLANKIGTALQNRYGEDGETKMEVVQRLLTEHLKRLYKKEQRRLDLIATEQSVDSALDSEFDAGVNSSNE